MNAGASLRLDAGWLRRLTQRLDRPAERPRVPLAIAVGRASPPIAIGSIEPALAARLAGAGLPLREVGDAWCIAAASEVDVDSGLAVIARWLRAQGHASAWRDELLAVTDSAGIAIGAIERAAVRPLGITTRAAHLIVQDAHGRVWVQQRAFDKATDPGQWDTTVGGLVAAGESISQTLERETWEEAGLRIGELNALASIGTITVRRPIETGYMVEHIDMFAATVPGDVVPANQDGEVERFECLGLAELVARMQADAFTLEAAMILAAWLARPQRR